MSPLDVENINVSGQVIVANYFNFFWLKICQFTGGIRCQNCGSTTHDFVIPVNDARVSVIVSQCKWRHCPVGFQLQDGSILEMMPVPREQCSANLIENIVKMLVSYHNGKNNRAAWVLPVKRPRAECEWFGQNPCFAQVLTPLFTLGPQMLGKQCLNNLCHFPKRRDTEEHINRIFNFWKKHFIKPILCIFTRRIWCTQLHIHGFNSLANDISNTYFPNSFSSYWK